MKRTLLFALGLILSLSLFAYDFQIGDLCYSITSTSERTVSVEASSTSLNGDVVIPSVVTYNDVDFTVTFIASNGFAHCYNITSFTIPNTVMGIGYEGFGWCWYLKTIILDNPRSSFSVGSYAFNYDWRAFKTVRIINIDEKELLNNGAGLLSSSSLPTHDLYINGNKVVDYKVADGVETINNCFRNCNSIETLLMPNSVRTIVSSACYSCTALKTITLSSKLESIGYNAFAECPELRTIYIKSAVPPSIDASTFPNGAYMFATVYVPKGTLSAYKNANIWSNFANIVETEYEDVPDMTQPVEALTLEKHSLTLKIGETERLYAQIAPLLAGNKTVNWSSADEEVASVDSTGTVKALAAGKTWIMAVSDDNPEAKDSCQIVVPDTPVPAPNGECTTPVIIVSGNKMTFECETPDAEFTSYLTTSEEFSGGEVVIENKDITFTLTVYAIAPGYDRSKPATMKFTVKKSDVNGDGTVDVADIATIIDEMAARARIQEALEE